MRIEGYIIENINNSGVKKYEFIVPVLNILLWSPTISQGVLILENQINQFLNNNLVDKLHDSYASIILGEANNFEISCKDTKIFIAFILKKLRIKNNLTIRQLAAKMHSGHPNSVYQYESGACVAGFQKFQEFINIMGYDFKLTLVPEKQDDTQQGANAKDV